jgi:hypothetical protein
MVVWTNATLVPAIALKTAARQALSTMISKRRIRKGGLGFTGLV